MKIIALLGKGGTAKTTSAASLGHALARRGLRTVIVDLDVQASLSDWLVGERDSQPMIEDVIMGRAEWSSVLVELSDGLLIAPTMNFALKEVEEHIGQVKRQRELVLSRVFGDLDADVVLIDTPRGLDTNIALNVFEAMTGALVVSEPSPMSVVAQREIILAIHDYEEARGVPLLLGVLPTRLQKTSLSRLALDAMAEDAGLRVFTPIRHTVRASEAVAVDQLLWDYDNESTAAADYEVATDEIWEATA